MATGRVSVAEVQAADTVSAGSRSSNASSPVRSFFQFPRISVQAEHCQNVGRGQTAFEAGSWLGFSRASGDRPGWLRRSLTIWLDAEVMFVRTLSKTESI